jgi:hypothetical protein
MDSKTTLTPFFALQVSLPPYFPISHQHLLYPFFSLIFVSLNQLPNLSLLVFFPVVPYSLFLVPFSLFLIPYSLFLIPYSYILFLISYYVFLIPFFLIPYSYCTNFRISLFVIDSLANLFHLPFPPSEKLINNKFNDKIYPSG